jgi:uncharacterized protein (DUF305 family)
MKRTALILLALFASVVLAACGSSNDNSTAGGTDGSHNAADVTFAQGMIPHHRQAIEMARMATDRAAAPEVKTLASRIQAAQDPEIETMSGWLRSWGKDVPSSSAGMGHGGHSSTSMPGMMSSDQMNDLMAKGGTAFDRAFLTMMTGHHQGAIKMARTEQAQGGYGPAKNLAGQIVKDQQAEIDQMAALLTKQ